MNPLTFLLPIFTFSVLTQQFDPNLLNKIQGEWNVVAKNYQENKTCYYVNITNDNNEVFWNEYYQLNHRTYYYKEKINSIDFHTFNSNKDNYKILFTSYFKDFIVIQKNDELIVLSRNHFLTYDEFFYLGVSLNLITNDNIYFVNNDINFC